jgi:hypothetical protein
MPAHGIGRRGIGRNALTGADHYSERSLAAPSPGSCTGVTVPSGSTATNSKIASEAATFSP